VSEQRETFACFGGECTVAVDAPGAEAARAVADCKRQLLEWHQRFSRFEPGSELSALNADPRPTVPVSPMMRRVVGAALDAAQRTGGLIDPTLIGELEQAGYARHFDGDGLPLARALRSVSGRRAAGPSALMDWRWLAVERRTSEMTRPPGLRIDPGGIAKGVFADELAAQLSGASAFAIDCSGDIRLGGTAGVAREVCVESPFDGSVLHSFALADAGIATSGIGRRSWAGADGAPAHHLLDPATGRPAFTGVVQATAIAPTAAEAETLSKAALLAGPEHAAWWLPHGGAVVLDDGGFRAYAITAPGYRHRVASL
jgi:thiamine biosynthesis lipoprotein